MTYGGIIVMTLSAGGATAFFIFCLYHVIRALETDKNIAEDSGEDVNLDAEAGRSGSDEPIGK
jgi:hypothetical protein